MSLRFDIFGILSPDGGQLVACIRLPSGLVTAAGATITDDHIGVQTIDTDSTEIYLGLTEGVGGFFGAESVISALPDTTDRPYTVEVREVASGYDFSVYNDLVSAFNTDWTNIAAAPQVADGSMKGGWIKSGVWTLGESTSSGAVVGIGEHLRAVSVTDSDTSDPIQNALVRVTDGSVLWGPVLTNALGACAFALAPGTWTYYASAAGYGNTTLEVTVAASGIDAIELAPVSLPITSADTLTAFTTVTDLEGVPVGGATIQVALKAGTGTAGQSYSRAIETYTADGAGLVTLTLLKNSTYNVRLQQSTGVFGDWVTFESGATSPLALPEFVGRQVL